MSKQDLVNAQKRFFDIVLKSSDNLRAALEVLEIYQATAGQDLRRSSLIKRADLELYGQDLRRVLGDNTSTHIEFTTLAGYLVIFYQLFSGEGVLEELLDSPYYKAFKTMVEQEVPDLTRERFLKRYPVIAQRLRLRQRIEQPEEFLYDIVEFTGLQTLKYLNAFLYKLYTSLEPALLYAPRVDGPCLYLVKPNIVSVTFRRVLPYPHRELIVTATNPEEARTVYLEAYLQDLLSTVLVPLSYPHPRAWSVDDDLTPEDKRFNGMIETMLESFTTEYEPDSPGQGDATDDD